MAAGWCVVFFLASCGKDEPPPAPKAAEKAAPDPAAPLQPPVLAPRPADDLSVEVEVFTGGHTRIVWSQYQKKKSADPYSHNVNHFLFGLDTRDGRGIRPLRTVEGNYSRPLLSSDGSTILFSDKGITRDDNDAKIYEPAVYRLSWAGEEPKKIAEGYAVDTWVDPQTKIEWVYAIRELASSTRIAIEAGKLVRFQLNDPSKLEPVWDQTAVSPDNIQFSRDGRRASGQFPWPNAGQFTAGKPGLPDGSAKFITGCWPGMAPDNSYVSWALDGEHKQATFFTGDGSKSWPLRLNSHPDLEKGEIYHPRWSNHPRFLVLTGPYLGEMKPGEGSVIGKGGLTAEVYLAKLGEKLDKFDGWLRITSNERGDNFPDVWIAGGDKTDLAAFAQGAAASPVAADAWPANRDGLVFAWEHRNATNTVKLADGHQLDCSLETRGAARYGRDYEMLLDGGSFVPKADAAKRIAAAVASGQLTVEFVLALPSPGQSGDGLIASLPGVTFTLRRETIQVEKPGGIIGMGPVKGGIAHFSAVLGEKGWRFLLQEDGGKKVQRSSTGPPPAPLSGDGAVSFGGGKAKAGLLRFAMFARPLAEAELLERSKAMPELLPPPPRVRLLGKLAEASPMPTAEGIDPYTGALVECVYDVVKVIEGEYAEKQIFVKHWGMMDRKNVFGFPRKTGSQHELLVEPLDKHPQLKGDRSMPLDVFTLEPWYDVSPPMVSP